MSTEKGNNRPHENLCLEGVLEHQIANIVSQSANPQELTDELISLINARENELQVKWIEQRADIEGILLLPAKREQYADRVNPKEGPIEFLRRVWPESRSKNLYQFQLRHLDNILFVAVRNWTQRNGTNMRSLLPPKSTYIDKLISEHPEVVKLAATMYSSLSRRQRK